ncbi:MAG: hypothetical protein OXT09_11265 [Myxococcales bacterium]|nr:hypothetical protein [Myxococcales bacterium]
MLTAYLACLLFGGTLVAFSVLGGAFDGDADLDADADADGDDVADVALGWLPLSSLRFWTFMLAFGGLTGALLTWLGTVAAPLVALIALAVGYLSGIGITRAVHHLGKTEVGAGITADDFVGVNGSVLLPVGRARLGQVRVEIGGRFVDRSATTEDATPLPPDTPVLVYGVHDDGSLQVTRAAAADAPES